MPAKAKIHAYGAPERDCGLLLRRSMAGSLDMADGKIAIYTENRTKAFGEVRA